MLFIISLFLALQKTFLISAEQNYHEMAYLIADSGSTKCEWCLVDGKKKKLFITQGISPYFLSGPQIMELVTAEALPQLKNSAISEVFYYGAGCKDIINRKLVKKAVAAIFSKAQVTIHNDLMGAARALCGKQKGIACILGTGSNSCYFDGKTIKKNSPGLGYVMGDEGSGAYLGKRLLQYYLYNTMDEELRFRFLDRYPVTQSDILDHVYKKPLPNRYLASFAIFLAENRGHYMIENIIEDGLNDFFFQHLCKYGESWKLPINFVGSVAYGFKDVIEELCHTYEFDLGTILKSPMEGLIRYHSINKD